jgi:kumamolisin
MTNSENKDLVPNSYVRLPGSERYPSKEAQLLGPADPNEIFSVTIVLRRRPDGPPMPDFEYFAKTPPTERRRMPQDEFAAKYGAAQDDINKVVEFARSHDLKIVETNAARRTVVVSGTVAQMSKAFGVTLGRYQRVTSSRRAKRVLPHREIYRGRDGSIHVPRDLTEVIVGVFGLDNRRISKSHVTPADPPFTNQLTINQVTQLYNFPSPGPSIAGQTIGIIAATNGWGGYLQSDLNEYFASIGAAAVQPIPVSVDGITNTMIQSNTTADAPKGTSTLTFPAISNLPQWSWGEYSIGANTYYFEVTNVTSTATATTVTVEVYDPATNSLVTTGFATDVPADTPVYFNLNLDTYEATQDICIAASAAPGAKVAVYFTTDNQAGWVDLISRAIHPDPRDFPAGVNPPSVLSSSWFIGADDPDGLSAFGISATVVQAMDMAFQDAALQGLTVCICSGDQGTWGQMNDGYAHAYYPPSDPYVLSVGGTTVGQYQPTGSSTRAWVEFLWNDTFFGGAAGATGGGVSDFFPVPSYQNNASVPDSINKTINPAAPFNSTGRGFPDVAGNASPNSGYPIFVGGEYADANGTSASTPLWAALIALLNSNLGFDVGFLNPSLYALGSTVFNPISPLWPDPPYPQLAQCPTDNGMNGIPGYKAGPGWDACTGWGSPNGKALLNGLKKLCTGTVMGTVYCNDPDSGDTEPAAGATVTMLGQTLSTRTDKAGSYMLCNVPSGLGEFKATLLGCFGKTESVTVSPGQTAVLDFTLVRRPPKKCPGGEPVVVCPNPRWPQ